MTQQIWFAVFGPKGLHSADPAEAQYDDATQEWKSADGDVSGSRLGLEATKDRCTYTNFERDQVVAWVRGVQAACFMLSQPQTGAGLK